MSGPLSFGLLKSVTEAAVGTAASATRSVVNAASKIDFAQVFSPASETAPSAGGSADRSATIDWKGLRAKMLGVAESILQSAGISPNPPVMLTVQSDGRILAEGDHPKISQIEALLAQDEQAQAIAGQLSAAPHAADRQFVLHQIE